MPVDVAATEEHLQLVGMDAGQAAAYVRIAVAGPMRAAELAGAMRVSRQEAYRLLHAMIARGFVVSDLGHPATFSATPPAEIFARAMASETAKVQQLTHADELVTEALATLRPEAPLPAMPTFGLVRGRREVLSLAASLVSGAQRDVRMLSTHPATVNLGDLSGILPMAAKKARAGVRVRGILRAGPIDPRVAKAASAKADLRTLDRDVSGGLLVVDESAVLLSFVSDSSSRLHAEGDVSLWSDARDLVLLQATLFDALWERAQPLAAGGLVAA